MALDAYLIQYRFIIPKELKHSSYTYQKLFRALYGYTQVVQKHNGKTYRYHRKGVLSDFPFIRPSKNTVIIPPSALQSLLNFFNTGKNPAHRWQAKGSWRAVYYMNEYELAERDAAKALEKLLDRIYLRVNKTKLPLLEVLRNYLEGAIQNVNKEELIKESKKLISCEWFKKCYSLSEKLKEFKKSYELVNP